MLLPSDEEHPMPNQIAQATISQLIPLVEQLTGAITAQVGALSPSQLNWKPNPAAWSVGQGIEHVVIANRSYFPILEQIVAGTRVPRLVERLPLAPVLFGRLLIASLDPARLHKVRTAKVFEPTLSVVEPSIVAAFTQQQQRLVELMQACSHLDAARIIITSPAVSFITYSLLDAFRILVVHEQHHFASTAQLLKLPAFPSA
jgi:hypothetical protein